MLSDHDRMAILEVWSQFRPGVTEEHAYPQILQLIESTIMLKLSSPVKENREVNRVPVGLRGTNGG